MRATTMPSPPPDLANLIGSSDAMVAVRRQIDRLARTDTPVLVTGPAGSGKALVAQLIHQRSPRAARPFIAVNCAAVPRDRLATEVFGHAVALNGATPLRRSRFDEAAGGTVFLDAIGDLPAEVQARLLRVVAAPSVDPADPAAPRPPDVRVVATSTRDIGAAVAAGQFLADLFDRFAVVALPALAARPEDLPQLVAHFAATEAARAARPSFTADALAYLARQPWSGNVRELRNFVARAAAIDGARMIDEPRAAVLLHGERRAIDRWLDTAQAPLPLPNRRRPPPFVAAGEVVDVKRLLSEFEQTCLLDALGPSISGGRGRLFGVPWAMLVESMRRLNSARHRDRGSPA